MQSILDSCGCHASKPSDSQDRGLVFSLPIPYCANSLLYVDFIHGLPKFGGCDNCLVVTCGLTTFTRAFPCNKKITGEQTVKMLVDQWFKHYGVPKEVHSDEDVRIQSDTGWYKRVLDALNVHVTTGGPYTHTSNPLCERQNPFLLFCTVHPRVTPRVLGGKETEPCAGAKPEDSDETGAYQRLGMSVTLGFPNHELSGQFLNWLYPPRTVPWGASCMVL